MADPGVTPRAPGGGGGGRLRPDGVVRALAGHGPVDVLYPAIDETPPSPEYRAMANVSVHPVEPKRGPGRGVAFAGAVARGVPPGFARGMSRELVAAAEELADAPGRG